MARPSAMASAAMWGAIATPVMPPPREEVNNSVLMPK